MQKLIESKHILCLDLLVDDAFLTLRVHRPRCLIFWFLSYSYLNYHPHRFCSISWWNWLLFWGQTSRFWIGNMILWKLWPENHDAQRICISRGFVVLIWVWVAMNLISWGQKKLGLKKQDEQDIISKRQENLVGS